MTHWRNRVGSDSLVKLLQESLCVALIKSKALKAKDLKRITIDTIVQEKAVKASGYDSIVVPMDLHKETKQKLSIVANLAKYFNSKVHVVTPDETDEFLRHQVISNITFSEGFFKDRGIEMTSAVVPSSGFDKEVVKYAVSVDADLIAIMNLQRNNLFTALTSNHEQYIITNDALIPTLIVNPIHLGSDYSNMFSM